MCIRDSDGAAFPLVGHLKGGLRIAGEPSVAGEGETHPAAGGDAVAVGGKGGDRLILIERGIGRAGDLQRPLVLISTGIILNPSGVVADWKGRVGGCLLYTSRCV